MTSTLTVHTDAATVAYNLRRHMAREGLTFEDIITATELDDRTIRGVARGTNNPQARTLHKLAQGLGIQIDDLFRTPGRHTPQQFDRATNTLVDSIISSHAEVFQNWSEPDFDELYSRFGTGGQLTPEGILAAAEVMNAKRDVWRQISAILESGEANLFTEFVELLYRRATLGNSPTSDQ